MGGLVDSFCGAGFSTVVRRKLDFGGCSGVGHYGVLHLFNVFLDSTIFVFYPLPTTSVFAKAGRDEWQPAFGFFRAFFTG